MFFPVFHSSALQFLPDIHVTAVLVVQKNAKEATPIDEALERELLEVAAARVQEAETSQQEPHHEDKIKRAYCGQDCGDLYYLLLIIITSVYRRPQFKPSYR
uniref:Uncharacterized protein n=1 Tax=Caenorhabditis japonica TaxID=281687 RepID=A0A8R1EH05_CAEJA